MRNVLVMVIVLVLSAVVSADRALCYWTNGINLAFIQWREIEYPRDPNDYGVPLDDFVTLNLNPSWFEAVIHCNGSGTPKCYTARCYDTVLLSEPNEFGGTMVKAYKAPLCLNHGENLGLQTGPCYDPNERENVAHLVSGFWGTEDKGSGWPLTGIQAVCVQYRTTGEDYRHCCHESCELPERMMVVTPYGTDKEHIVKLPQPPMQVMANFAQNWLDPRDDFWDLDGDHEVNMGDFPMLSTYEHKHKEDCDRYLPWGLY